jgi:hypothetical protein
MCRNQPNNAHEHELSRLTLMFSGLQWIMVEICGQSQWQTMEITAVIAANRHLGHQRLLMPTSVHRQPLVAGSELSTSRHITPRKQRTPSIWRSETQRRHSEGDRKSVAKPIKLINAFRYQKPFCDSSLLVGPCGFQNELRCRRLPL